MTYIPDINSGISLVGSTEKIMIVENCQSINYGCLEIQGELIIQGTLILK
jgi:hypothetical protein